MKKILSIAMILLVSTTVLFARKLVSEGRSHTPLGSFRIEQSDNPVNIKGQDCPAYVIVYENTPMEVTVVICKDKKKVNPDRYIVLSDKLSVQYVSYSNYFGVEKLGTTFDVPGYKTSESSLNTTEYFRQKVLSPGLGTEIENTRLIAAFFPMLMNEQLNATASK